MLQKGEILNNTYQVIGPIGSGGGGTVYRAYHLNLKKDVVLKLINDKAKKSLDARGEVDILKNVKHTYLPTVFDFQEVNGQIYTVMDFVQGSDFSKLLKDGNRFSQKDVIKWAGQLCEALDYLHRQNPPIIHSDIKPANIMLTPEGDICLIDFNVSQLFSDDGTVVRGRTHGYAPPEQYETTKNTQQFEYSTETEFDETVLDGETETDSGMTAGTAPSVKLSGFGVSYKLDARSDIYSLGATLYHILSGVRPNHSMQPQVPIRAKVPDISQGLEYIITKAMSFDQGKRFSSAAEMLNAIKNIHKLDGIYKEQQRKKKTTKLLYTVMFIVSAAIAGFGLTTISSDRSAQYDTYVSDAVAMVQQYDIENALETAEDTIEKYPQKAGGYYTKALALYTNHDYEGAINHITSYLNSGMGDDEPVLVANIYHVMGNCRLETEDYQTAVNMFSQAVFKNPSNPDYYRDWAIAYARLGDYTKAQEILTQAKAQKLDSESLALVENEIRYAMGDYSGIYGLSGNLLATSAEPSLKERAAVLESDAAKAAGDYSYAAQVLENAKSALPQQNTRMITEMLGEVYAWMAQPYNKEYTLKAIDCFEELLEGGYSRFYIMQNIAILYQNIDYFSQAEDMLNQMEEKHSGDYRVYMQKAFLYIDMQSGYANENRNYSRALNNYNKAQQLYSQSSQYGSDTQMLMLQGYIEDLRYNGWI